MKNLLLNFFLAIFCLGSMCATAQVTDTTNYNPGIWQAFGDPLPANTYSEVRGRLCNFRWADIETAPNVWNWTQFDSDLTVRAKDLLPIIFMVYTKEDAPNWLYTNGVPKVNETDLAGNITGSSPYYADPEYKAYFKRMITTVRQHVETLPAAVRKQIVGVQPCFGSTGDFISYSGAEVPSQYVLSTTDFSALFREFTQYYYDEYKNTNPKIIMLSNPKNRGMDDALWLIQNCPGGWLKNGTIGKAFQLNDELDKSFWLYNIINQPQAGNYVRMRAEIVGSNTLAGWWTKATYKNMFAIMCYSVYWGLDWPNQGNVQIADPLFDSSFSFFNKYAGQKNPVKSTNAMCALKDVLDASDSVRFPAAAYGTVSRTNTQRYQNIAKHFSAYGAKLEDVNTATQTEMNALFATGTNDVGWRLLPDNYDRYLHQLIPNQTSIGYWNVQSADTNSMYGRFARGFDVANNKKALYFDVDNEFLSNAPLNGSYPVTIDITYLDNGSGRWQLYYDSKNGTDASSIQVTCGNTNRWKKVSVTLSDAYFGNRGINGSDFYIGSTNNANVIFAVVELARPNRNLSNIGLFASALSSFDTVCVNSKSVAKSFSLTGAFLNNSDITVGPLPSYTFSTDSDGIYSDSLTIGNYGASFSKTIYVKFNPKTAGAYNGSVSIKGGGKDIAPIHINVTGVGVKTSPVLSANITNITCNNAKNGAINLALAGGTSPFTYSWTCTTSNFKSSNEDISSLIPGDYSVNIASPGGCNVSATYSVTQPDALVENVSADSMVCRGGTTTVYVTATGGTMPYSGTGKFTGIGYGAWSYAVTDAKGCSVTKLIRVVNGTLLPPAKPSVITGTVADATGLCGGGNFNYTIDPVSTATSYTWTTPAASSIGSTRNNGTAITLIAASNFSSGNLFVTANNVCGSSRAVSKTLNSLPAKPAAISGPISVSSLQTGLKYSVPSVAGLTYVWTVPGTAKIISGQNTAAITVTWGGASGYVKVTANNNCGASSISSLSVSILSSLSSQSNLNAVIMAMPKAPMVFPNPAKNIAYVSFEAKEEYKYKIELTDLSGKLLQRKDNIAFRGENRVSIDVHTYTSGMYLVTIINEKGERNTMKLIKE